MYERPTPTQRTLQARRMVMNHHTVAHSEALNLPAERFDFTDQLMPWSQRRLA